MSFFNPKPIAIAKPIPTDPAITNRRAFTKNGSIPTSGKAIAIAM